MTNPPNPSKTSKTSKTSREKKQAIDKLSGPDSDSPLFPIVGVGASAGGLETFTELLQHIPMDTGMAFVLIQHLDPSHKSMLTELLSRTTKLPVIEATDQLAVKPDHIYVIPPDTNLGILHGILQLMPRGHERKQHLPIDYFMRSLAEDRGAQAIGIILSGTASDGAQGLRAIKAEGGITLAQDPESAKYDGMPRSAIRAGCVDFILPTEEIAHELTRIAGHPTVIRADLTYKESERQPIDALNKIFLLLRSHTGHDFTYYKHSTIERRINRRMLLHKLERTTDYVKLLQHSNAEIDDLFQDILINVTGFFRDPEAFEGLKHLVFPKVMGKQPLDEPFRIWIPGCSSGEEAYTVAITLIEFCGGQTTGTPIQIFGTDIDDKAIDKARLGIYPEAISGELSPTRLKRFFAKVPEGYQIGKSIRNMCVFAVQNVTKDPPFSKLDLVCCRNLLIYLGPILQKKVLQLLHYALKPNGFLMLGTSETIGRYADLFTLVGKKEKIYIKKPLITRINYDLAVNPYLPVDNTGSRAPIPLSKSTTDVPQQADRIVLNQYAPPGVIINSKMEILHFRGQTGPYIAPVPGVASLNLVKIASQDLVMELRSVVQSAISKETNKRKENVKVRINGEQQTIDIQVIVLKDQITMENFYLVLFEKQPSTTPIPPALNKKDIDLSPDEKEQRIAELDQELLTTKEYMQSIIEEQEATNEELTSASEETQSANEELQSTNEELETAKEELQSTNEELATVNEELENRNRELTRLNNDLTNLLSSVNLAIIMLDEQQRIRHFTPQAQHLFNLIGTDIGRPITDIKPKFQIPDLGLLALEVVDTMTTKSLDIDDGKGHHYNLITRPYRTSDNRITGAVFTFFDASVR